MTDRMTASPEGAPKGGGASAANGTSTANDTSTAADRATKADLPAIEALLRANNLPTEGVADLVTHFHVVRLEDGEVIAAGVLEPAGRSALLRSVVVDERARGTGLGGCITESLKEQALRDGLQGVYLLTETAEALFARRGFDRLDRATAPDAIRQTSEFSDLCPSTAVFMGWMPSKDVDRPETEPRA